MSFQELVDNMNAAVVKVREEVENFIIQSTSSIFEQYSDIETIGIPCYRDYFCDGGTCPYHVYVEGYFLNDIRYGSDYIWDLKDEYDEEDLPVDEEIAQEIEEKLSKVFDTIPYSIMESICEDGLLVIEADGKITFEDYDHD